MKYFNFKYPLQIINDKWYHIVAQYNIDNVKDSQGLKDFLNCDVVFKQSNTNTYLFCREVPEVEFYDLN